MRAWTIRAVIYFVLWAGFLVFRKLSIQQDKEGARPSRASSSFESFPGIIAFGFTVTFAAIDWNMSINPHFYSTMCVQFFAGCLSQASA